MPNHYADVNKQANVSEACIGMSQGDIEDSLREI